MSTNCVRCIKNKRTGFDLLCDSCRKIVIELEKADERKYDYDDWDPEDAYCCRCDNSGFIVTCFDDICRGLGECIHGDGEDVCPDCGGKSAL